MRPWRSILMIRPVRFEFNAQTSLDNAFQVNSTEVENVQELALTQFNNFVENLLSHKIQVTVIEDTLEPHTPDSIFPNNWISFHDSGTLILYPMYAPNRRAERRMDIIEEVGKKFLISKTIDLTYFEAQHKFLEGTGSLVLDRENKILYACLSARTHREVINRFYEEMGFIKAVIFEARDQNNVLIYHTNVLMCLADRYCVVCLDTIKNSEDRAGLISSLQSSGKEIIEITLRQMNSFAGNMLQVQNADGERLLVMSAAAYTSLSMEQIKKLQTFNQIIRSDLSVIERNGGGSARCMMAEIYLPNKNLGTPTNSANMTRATV